MGFLTFIPVAFEVACLLAALSQPNQIVPYAQGLRSLGAGAHLQFLWVYVVYCICLFWVMIFKNKVYIPSAAKLKYPYNIKICRRHLYGLTQAEYCNSNVLAYKRLAALVYTRRL